MALISVCLIVVFCDIVSAPKNHVSLLSLYQEVIMVSASIIDIFSNKTLLYGTNFKMKLDSMVAS